VKRLLLTLAVAACATSALTSFAQGGAPGKRVGWAGVTVALPASWHAMQLAAPAGVPIDVDPVARIAAASGPISFGRGCGEFPYSFPSTAVALVVLEWTRPTPGAFPKRPPRFTPKTLPIHRPPAVECFNGPAGSTEFTDRGRRFDAFLLLGRHARTALADRARAVLNTLSVVSRKPKARRSSAAYPAVNGTIAYKCGNSICLMRPDGSKNRTLLRGRPSPQWSPTFSPDGLTLAFRGYYGFNEGDYALYVSGTNGCAVRELTGGASDPAWSPDGNWIAFDNAGGGEIWKVRRDGTGLTRIASAGRTYGNSFPAWSPDGKQIVFVRYRTGSDQLWLMRSDGGHKTPLLRSVQVSEQAPAWSHDGRQIAFVARQGQTFWIDAVDANGSSLRRLTAGQTDAWNPVWLPHGIGIAFLRGFGGTGNLYVMRPDGKDTHKIAALATFEFDLTTAPLPRQAC
jgi:TolB protein